MVRKYLALSAVLLLAGCTSFHPQFKDPTPTWVGNWQKNATGLPWATSVKEAVSLPRQYGAFYSEQVSALVEQLRSLDDIFVGSTTGGVIGVVARDIRAVVAFAAAGGTVSILEQRYKFDSQAETYRRAMKSMECMDLKLFGLDKLAGYEGAINDDKATKTLQVLPSLVNEQIFLVRRRLRDQLDTMTLPRPDENAIRSAYAGVIQGAQQRAGLDGVAAVKAAPQGAGAPTPLPPGMDQATFKALWLRLVGLESELQKCVADS